MLETTKTITKSPLERVLAPGRFGAAVRFCGLCIRERHGIAMASMVARRGRQAELAHTLSSAYGLELPAGPRRSIGKSIVALGVGADRWIVMAEANHPDAMTSLAQSLKGLASLSDQSSAYAVLRIDGPRVREVLAKGVGIDLHPQRFGPSDVAATGIALVAVVLWQVDDRPSYEIAVPRSWVASFVEWLIESGAEFGVDVPA